MAKLTLEEPKFEGIFQAFLTETGQHFDKTPLRMHIVNFENLRSDTLDICNIRNEIRKKLLKEAKDLAFEYEEKSRRNINFWQDKYGYEITEIITKGRIKLHLLIDTRWISENSCDDWRLLIEDVQEKGGKVAAYGKNIVGQGASDIFFQADERYALADTEFRWAVKKTNEEDDRERYLEEWKAILDLFKQEAIECPEKSKILVDLTSKFTDREKALIYLRKNGMEIQKMGMLSGIIHDPEDISLQMSYSMYEALGLNIVSTKNPPYLNGKASR